MSETVISGGQTERKRRRKGTEKRQRSVALAVRFSAEERAELEAAAASAGVALGSYIRHQSLGGKRPRAAKRAMEQRQSLRLSSPSLARSART